MAARKHQNSEFERMTAELQAQILDEQRRIYSEAVLREASNPRNMGRLEQADAHARRQGSCGETIELWLRIADETIQEARFLTDGCGPAVACGSMLTTMVTGKSLDNIEDISPNDLLNALNGLPEESIHCAHLAVTTLRDAIDQWWQGAQELSGGSGK